MDIFQDDMTFIDQLSYTPQDSFLGESSETWFMPLASQPEQEIPLLRTLDTANHAPFENLCSPYNMTYPQASSVTPDDHNPSTDFSLFETSSPFFTKLVPIAPQEVVPAQLDFNPLPVSSTHPQHSSTTLSFSGDSHGSSLSSTSSLPSPTRYPLADGCTPTILRQTLRSDSISSKNPLDACGIPLTISNTASDKPSWKCAYLGCTSKAIFKRLCDLRKHYNRHFKHLFCRIDGCPQSQTVAVARSTDQRLSVGFSSRKDRARHEAKHNPAIRCEWKGPQGEKCGRFFSRRDNMKDHVWRVHKKQEQKNSRP